jgi:N-acetylglucosaminyl-diphospho-decaprenol L-rhamnosyltransferase
MSDLLDVEISVVNTNNRALLERCLRSLPDACEGLRWHVTVVDNASTDGSDAMVAATFPWAGVFRSERRLGFSASHNRVILPAIAGGRSRYVMILNEDTELEPGAVRKLVDFADSDPKLGAVGPRIHGPDGNIQPSWFRFPTLPREIKRAFRPGKSPTYRVERGWLNGSCVLLRAAALRDVGALDERFFIFCEDIDIALRLLGAGWKSKLAPEARMLHLGHQTVGGPAIREDMGRQMLRSKFQYFDKHHGALSASLVTFASRIALALRGARAGATGLRNEAMRAHASLLIRLARYDPRDPLPHESEARPPGPGSTLTGGVAAPPAEAPWDSQA